MKRRAPHVPTERAERVYGLAAAIAAFEHRPDAVLNIAYTRERRNALAEVLRTAAKKRIAYREVDGETLDALSGSVHHEGVCMLLRPRQPPAWTSLVENLGERCLVLALDGVQNPHNIGAIVRSAAYFGADALLFVSADHKPLTAAARRVAEGGAEHLALHAVSELPAALLQLRDAGLSIIGCDTRAKLSLDRFVWPPRSALVLGHEQKGLSPEVRRVCKPLVRIAGANTLDSLNVSVSAGIFLASHASQQRARSGAAP